LSGRTADAKQAAVLLPSMQHNRRAWKVARPLTKNPDHNSQTIGIHVDGKVGLGMMRTCRATNVMQIDAYMMAEPLSCIWKIRSRSNWPAKRRNMRRDGRLIICAIRRILT
jgi:hypothetical protein